MKHHDRTPAWDVLIGSDDIDVDWHSYFPAAKTGTVGNLIALEGVRFRNCYLTSKAIEKGSAALFGVLYRAASITPGSRVLHVSDFEEDHD